MAGRPPGSSADGRFRLLDACWSLLLENEPGERLTIAAVCERAGCTPPTLYHHFGDLASLEAAASSRAFDDWHTSLTDEFSKLPDPKERLRRFAQAYLDWAIENPDAYTILFGRPGKLGSDAAAPRFPALMQTLADIHGRSPDHPSVFAQSFAIWCCLHGTAMLAIAAPTAPRAAQRATLDYVVDALNAYGPPREAIWATQLLAKRAEEAAPGPRGRRFRY